MNGADQEDAWAALAEATGRTAEQVKAFATVAQEKPGPYAPISSGKEARRIRRIGERRVATAARKGRVA